MPSQVSTCGIIPIHCGCDLLNKDSFIQNELEDFSMVVLTYGFLLYGYMQYTVGCHSFSGKFAVKDLPAQSY